MNEEFMKERPVLPLLLSMALPMILSMLVNSLYNIVDSFFVAKISEDAMTALSLVFPIQNFVNAVAIGFGVGINAVIAFYLGAKEPDKANAAASKGTLLSVVHGVIMTVVCIRIMPGFLRMFTSNMRSPEIPHFPNFIYCMFEDNRQNVYLGSTTGLSILTKEGKFYHYNNLLSPQGQYSHSVYSIAQDSLNNIWIGTDHSGIFRINPTQDLSNCTFSSYSINNNKINSNEIQCIFVNKEGNILAGTDGGGLNLYDPHLDSFISIHTQYNIPGDMICSILEDKQQNLWMGSNVGLIKLNLKDSIAESKCRLYTTSDGLQDNKFARGAACQAEDGEMFFGGPQGYNSFYPESYGCEFVFLYVLVKNISPSSAWHAAPRANLLSCKPSEVV